MDGLKLSEVSEKANKESPRATYKPISEKDVEGEIISRTKETDGADEEMLPKDNQVLNSGIDLSEVKVPLNEKQNGDAKLDIGEAKNIFGGMDKEELMKYAHDPFWVRLRWFLFIVFWLLWAGMLVGAIMIIYAAPKCDPPPPKTWWQEGPITEIEAETKPEDLKLLDDNIKGLIIVNCLDDAYDDFDESHNIIKIIKQANDLNKKIIIELDPATSTVWFNDSEAKTNSLSDYYIWKSPKIENGNNVVPNNWLNATNQTSWTYSTARDEYYYSPLGKPHLNFRNENVTKAFSNVIIKFLDYGASGIQLKNAPLLLVDPKFEDKETKDDTKTENLLDLGPLLEQWKAVVRNKTVNGPFMIKEEITNPDVYKVNNNSIVDLPLKAQTFSTPNISVEELVNSLNDTFNISNIEWPLWKINSTVFPKDVIDIVTYLLPGVPLVNYTDKISKDLLKMRQSPSVMRGICSIHLIHNHTVFSYIRVTSGNPGFLVALNAHNEKVTVDFPKEIPALSALNEVTIQLYSKNFNESDSKTGFKKDATAVSISPKSVIVLSYVPKKNE